MLLACLVNWALLTELLLYSRNTPAHHPELILGKLLAEVPVMGGELAFSTRNVLAHNRLNLDAWHGFQEVLWNRVGRLTRVSFRYRLAADAYVVVMLDKTSAGFHGLRLSRNPAFPSISFEADGEGRFLTRARIADPGPGWQTFTWEGSAGEGVFGLRGGAGKAEVDDVVLTWGDGVVRQNFRNHQVGYAAVAAFVVVGLLALLPLRRGIRKEGLLWCFLLQLGLGFFFSVAFAFDWLYWSPRYHQKNNNLFDAEPERFERWRRDLTAVFDFPGAVPDPAVLKVLGAAVGGHPPYRLQVQQGTSRRLVLDEKQTLEHPLVMLLGTSQTYGEGAPRLSESLASWLARGRPDVLFVNAAMRGSESFDLVKRWDSHLAALKPDLVVVNLGTNDREPEPLREALTRLASSKVPMVFVIEANSTEVSHFLARNAAVMKEVAGKFGLPVLDLNAALARQADEGLLWWDFVHPTALGHRLAGEWLAQELPR